MIPSIPFTSRMSKRQYIFAFIYFVIHLYALPALVTVFYANGYIDYTAANMLVYAVGLVYMVATQFSFLRREFDSLCDNLPYVIRTVLYSYLGYWCINYGIAILLYSLGFSDNPNQSAVSEIIDLGGGSAAAMTVIMAPIVEELLFRGALFGLFRKKSRTLAYIISIAAFSLYHVLSYVMINPVYLVYLVQYIPVSWLLVRCYEKTNSIWASIFLHMTVNGVSLLILNSL